jgi:AcrR family transcriptional regulator
VSKKSDKGGTLVRKASKRETDPRVDQSTAALGSALVALMHERAFDAITVQDVLDRAGVSRSTFYAHFSNKQDLFLSDYERLLAHLDQGADTLGAQRLLPVAELVAHFAEVPAFVATVRDSGQMETVWQLMSAQFARTIARRAVTLGLGNGRSAAAQRAAAVFCAGALMELIRWWLEQIDRPPPPELDRQFHEMALRALG